MEFFLKGYRARNQQMNALYDTFCKMCRVLTIVKDSHESGHLKTNDECLRLIDAIDIFQKFSNRRAEGVCYLNLGSLMPTSDIDEYHFAQGYINLAISKVTDNCV